MSEAEPTEQEVRHMRDLVYGVPCTDGGWRGCSENWMQPENVEWLREQAAKSKPTETTPIPHQ